MKKWDYTVSTNTIWTSFDYGQVEAETRAEAFKKAVAQLNYDFKKANEILGSCDPTLGFTISFDESQVEITEVLERHKVN